MSNSTRVGIIGGGWPGVAHARGYRAAGGFAVVAVADLIPQRRQKLTAEVGPVKEYIDAMELIEDESIDAVSICLPTHLHLEIAKAAFKAGKHVVLETPPGLSVKEAKQIAAAAGKSGKVLSYAFQRRFGGAELAAKQAIDKGYAGEPYHARATWMRTRGVPIGTGWYTDRAKSGGGALLDLGSHMLDIAWHLLGQPEPVSVYAVNHNQLSSSASVEDSAFALLRFEGGKSLELGTSWAINQGPLHNGTSCRVYGTKGGLEVYTPAGAVLYRQFGAKGEAKETVLKQPKVAGHAALLRHFRECILGRAQANTGPEQGIAIMRMIEALYKSAETGKSVTLSGTNSNENGASPAAAKSRSTPIPIRSAIVNQTN
jgi:predicted dehydrogenase